jgi:aryl-alcohol dehydrogenase-like predicted oxidoreductase
MQYRRLGSTGLKVSEISLGTWISCDKLDEKAASIQIIDRAYQCGVNFFDTANVYSDGRAETILGEALRKYPRESYVLATKVFWPMGAGPNDRGLSRKHIHEQIDKSLKRLGVDYIDLYYCHWFDPQTSVDETLRAMDDLVARGKVLYFGVSNWTAAQIAEGIRSVERFRLHPIVANQPSYNMFDRYIEAESIPLCSRHGIGQVVYSPLAQGTLTGKYRKGAKTPEGSRAANRSIKAEITVGDYMHDDLLAKVEQLLQIAEKMGVSLAQLAIAWVLRQPNVASAIVGASRPQQVEENVKASGIIIPDDVMRQIEDVLSVKSYVIKHNIVTL